jgi:4-diphosphocytidyl-2-C-methyl-D-erythritol kinase
MTGAGPAAKGAGAAPGGVRAFHDLPAPAKLNLFLHVVGRRADGYHLLQSAFVLIDWCDRLHVERRDDGLLRRHDLGIALPADDLCLRAARALQQASGTPLGANLRLDKRLPWGAGLGGGSSDAATTLLALNRLWNLHWPRARLLEIGATLGADVPFFVGGRNAFVEGIGERLTPIDWPVQAFAVVKPAAALATAAIFASPGLKRDTPAVILSGSLAGAAEAASFDAGFGRNDLQPVAEAACPDVSAALQWLQARFGNSRMTGSGSAVFARVGMDEATRATGFADDLPAGWVGRLCRSLDRHPLWGWAG